MIERITSDGVDDFPEDRREGRRTGDVTAGSLSCGGS